VGSVPDLVSSLRQQDTRMSSWLLDSVVELVDCLMFQHPGFPDLYEPVVDALKVSKLPLYMWHIFQGHYICPAIAVFIVLWLSLTYNSLFLPKPEPTCSHRPPLLSRLH